MSKGTARKAQREVAAAEQARAALELRKAGLTYDEVSKRLGMSGEGQAWKVVQRALQALPRASAEAVKALEVERLDALHAAAWTSATAGATDAIGAALKVGERRARLLGLDAPQKLEHSGEVSTTEYHALRARLALHLCDGCRERVLAEGGDE